MSFIYPSKSLSRCFETVVSIVACSYILTDARAIGELIGVDKSIVCHTRRTGDRPGAARALRNRRLEVMSCPETDVSAGPGATGLLDQALKSGSAPEKFVCGGRYAAASTGGLQLSPPIRHRPISLRKRSSSITSIHVLIDPSSILMITCLIATNRRRFGAALACIRGVTGVAFCDCKSLGFLGALR